MRGNLARRVAERVTLTRPAKIQELGDSDFRELIALCMGKSERYGIDGERDLATLAEFMLDISSNFDDMSKYAWTRTLLNDSSLDSNLKMELLHFRMTGLARPV